MSNHQHLKAGKHPFGIAPVTPRPKMARMEGVVASARGTSAPGQAANAAMKKSPGKR